MKVEIGYYRTSRGCAGVQLDLNAGLIFYSSCEPRYDRGCDTDSWIFGFSEFFVQLSSYQVHYRTHYWFITCVLYLCKYFS